ALAALLAVKVAVTFGAAQAMRVEAPVAAEVAFLLAGAGEFAFVVFALAAREGVVSGTTLHLAISIAALSMLAIPLLGAAGERAGRRLKAWRGKLDHGVDHAAAETYADHVVIGGFGRVGRTVAGLLEAEGVPYVVLDLDVERVSAERRTGRPVFYGDAGRREILERLGGAAARAFVVTTDEPEASERMVAAIREAWPDAVIHARARDIAHARRLRAIGVAGPVPETLEGSLQLGGQVLTGIGLPDEAVDARLAAGRAAAIRRLDADG
ncbi:MAG TPA: NAD-binding protein, partial [Bauldia sp.]|nr:NAD-binding protein [Bauldia sp.]